MWFPNRSDSNRPAQLQKQASVNRVAKTKALISFAPCFRICRLLVFPCSGSNICITHLHMILLGHCPYYIYGVRSENDILNYMYIRSMYVRNCHGGQVRSKRM